MVTHKLNKLNISLCEFEVFKVTFDPVNKLIKYLAHGLIVFIDVEN